MKKSQWALHHVPFEGKEITVTWSDGHSESAVASRIRDGLNERTVYLAPAGIAGRVYLTDAKTIRIYNPKSKKIVVRQRGGNETEEMNLPLLLANYRLVLDPRVRTVADRPSRLIHLRPKAKGKPRKILWLDKATGLPLKHERFHADGSPAGLTQFNEIAVGKKIPPARFAMKTPKGTRVVREGQSPKIARPAAIRPTLPAGYRLQECKASTSRTGWQCIYSDGLDLVSVFTVEKKGSRASTGTGVTVGSYPGRVSRESHHWMVTWNERDRQWTLIGDLSRELALQIAGVVAMR